MSQEPNPNHIIQEVLTILDKIEARYPHDIFPPDGESQDCAGARFVRKILSEIRSDVLGIDAMRLEMTPLQLAKEVGMSPSGIWRRLRHRNCPSTERYISPDSNKLMSLMVTEELMQFLRRPKARGKSLLQTTL